MEGTVQVFAQTGHSPEVRQSTWDNEDMNGYQLLNEVGSGGTLSSLFTILSLFTEDVQMSWQDESPDVSSDDMPAFTSERSIPKNRMRRANSDVSQFDLGPAEFAKQTARRSSVSSATSTIHGGHKSSRAPSSTNSGYSTPATPTPPIHQPRFIRPTQEYKGVVARATVDTTLAVIPAEAFRRLTKKFPKATGHIVQGLNHPFTPIL